MTLGFGAIGFYDDYLKVTQADPCRRSPASSRLVIEAVIAAPPAISSSSLGREPFATSLTFPFFKECWSAARLVLRRVRRLRHRRRRQCGEPHRRARRARHRAGDDRGAARFGFIAYLVGNAVFADYLQIHYVAGTGELAVLCGAVIGAGLGFLWFNAPPASIFMGDTGSLALGGMLGAIAVATKHEIVLAIDRRAVRARSGVGDRAGGVVQAHRQARVPDGADPPSLRAAGLDRAADRDPVLDHLGRAGAGRDCRR